MVSFLFLFFWAVFIALGYFVFIQNLWFIPLWFVLGPAFSILMFVIILVLLMPIMKNTKPNSKFKYILAKSFAKFLNVFIIRAKISVEGKENMPKNGKLTIYANHKSQTDPILIMSILNRSTAFTPKISLYKIPIISSYMHYIGCLPIDRDDNRRTAKTMIQAIKNVKSEHALIIFPEAGIKSRVDERINEIKGGAFQIGKKSESDFLPITIIGASEYSRRKSLFKKVKIKIIVHPVIPFDKVKDLSTQEMAELVKIKINEPFK